ncbi:PIN domain-containing protein [Roseofilum sp. BLCC_M154]|uniref:PIN domain-containing protein n=1 Tax=Roseofilum acuticapitatum BLCC-M154 TaxID=3022444 RepID=A0ABT7AU02_9CYAN|nr:PIN domain-containing protein [Roseofilum acuticapitatum BLCC-M154]
MDNFRRPFQVVGLSDEDVRVFGEIRADLEQRGTPIGAYDLLIAAQAKSRDLVLVTNNMREFERVSGLRLENWVDV